MATWKKVIVSGSNANLTTLQVDNLTSGSVVIGGGGNDLTTTAINGTGNIVATTGASGVSMTGSFTGSFFGDGSQLTGVVATDLAFELTGSTGIDSFTFDGSVAAQVAVSGASTLNSNTVTKWTGAAFANTNITDNGTVVDINSTTTVTGSLNVSGSQVELVTDVFRVTVDTNNSSLLEIDPINGVWITDIYTTNSLDTSNRYGFDSIGNNSIDWNNRQLIKSDGTSISVEWDQLVLNSGSGTSINWGDRILVSADTNDSLNWNNRQLIKSDGTTVAVDWENGIFSGSFSGSFQGDGAGLTNIPAGAITGLTLNAIATGSVTASVDVAVNSFTIVSGSTTLFNVRNNGGLEHGSNVTASGIFSHAEGNSTQAIGYASHAEGESTIAGYASHAEGESTQAIGQGSHAEGNSTQAIGEYSHAEGNSTQTGGTNGYLAISVVSGLVTLSGSYGDVTADYNAGDYLYLNDYSYDNNYITTNFVIDTVTFNSTETEILLVDTGVSTTTAVVGNINLGIVNWVGDQTYEAPYSHAEGNSTQAIGQGSHAEGESTQAIGVATHTEGQNTQAIGIYSHAEGEGSSASGYASHAEGENTQAAGYASHAEGDGGQSIGNYAHAEGSGTQAIGQGSHAEGQNTQAIGDYSHAEGIGTIASGSGQLVVGTYNTQNNTTSLVVIGNGADDNNRSDLALFNVGSITFNAPVTGSTFSGSFVGDGSGLTGLATTLSGSTDSGNFEVNLLNQYLTVQGTANEIEVSGSGQTITIGLPSDVTIGNNLIVTGDLTVNGTTTIINTTNTSIEDQFILLASGSTSTVDAGIIVQNAANAGEALYWENNTTGTSRWAIASNISPTATTVTAAEYMVTANTAAGTPSTAPTYGGSSTGYGNIYVNSSNGDIYIYS